MEQARFPARVGRSDGSLQLTSNGIEFVPEHARDGDQLGFSWDGFHLDWRDVDDVERVLKPRGARPAAGPGGQIRIHHCDCTRFVTVTVQAELSSFFAAFDARLAHARAA